MYSAFALLQSSTDFALGEAVSRLKARFPGFTVEREDNQIKVSNADWRIFLTENADSTVLAESVELAEKLAGADGTEISTCARRVEVYSDIPDPFMEHFNDFLFVIEVLQSFRGVIAVDPKEPALM